MNRIIIFSFLIYFIGLNSNAQAYLDPGTGSILLQSLAAVFIAVGVFWRRIVGFLKNLGKKDP